MRTFMPAKGSVESKWYVIDAEGQTWGGLSTRIAAMLMGKTKPTFRPPRRLWRPCHRHQRLAGEAYRKEVG